MTTDNDGFFVPPHEGDYLGPDGIHYAVRDDLKDKLDRVKVQEWLERIVMHLDGKTPESLYGPGALLSELDGSELHPDNCACAFKQVTSRQFPEQEPKFVAVVRRCPVHAHLGGQALFNEVIAENKWTTNVQIAVAEYTKRAIDTVHWHFAPNRLLTVTQHSINTPLEAAKAQVHVESLLGTERRFVIAVAN